MFETITINKIKYTHIKDEHHDFYEAHTRNYTGSGKTRIEALLDLRSKIKKREANRIKVNIFN